MPFFTVIVPTHGRPLLLLETLGSILSQSFKDFEVIVIDDCSPQDPTEAILALDASIRVFRQPTNQGPGAARNVGISNARGSYVAFLDDDDLWPPWTLQTYASAITRNNQPSVLSTNGVSFRDVTEVSCIRNGAVQERVFSDYLHYRTNPNQPGWLLTSGITVRREALVETGGFDPTFTYHEDEDMWLMLGTAPGFVRLAQPYCWFYRSHASMSSNLTVRFQNLERLMAKERQGAYPGGMSRARERMEIITQNGRHLARRGAREGFQAAAARLYGEMFGWNVALARWKFLSIFPAELAAGPFLKPL
jgi:GT2 family glycosyltransferase